LKILDCEGMKLDGVWFLPNVKILVLYNLRFLLVYNLLGILFWMPDLFPYPLTLKS
jgi:hypothetical protein